MPVLAIYYFWPHFTMKSKNKQRLILAILGLTAIFGTFSGSDEPAPRVLRGTSVARVLYALHSGNSILFNLSVGVLVSLFFWWLVVAVPQAEKRKMLRNNLQRQYMLFKEEVVHILLFAIGGSHDVDTAKRLLDYTEFQSYFKANNYANWYAALNGLQDEQGRINDLLVEMDILSREVAYVLNNIDVEDEQAHAFFKGLTTHLFRLKNCTTYTADHVKYLGQFIWELLGRWSFIDGQHTNDVVQDMIDCI